MRAEELTNIASARFRLYKTGDREISRPLYINCSSTSEADSLQKFLMQCKGILHYTVTEGVFQVCSVLQAPPPHGIM